VRRLLLAVTALVALAGCGGGSSTDQRAPETFGTRSATELLRDGLIMTGVKAKLTADDPDSATTVGVIVRSGVVTLRGTVRDARAKTQALADARRTAGIKEVIDELKIDPRGSRIQGRISDFTLAARITTAIGTEVGLNHMRVRVSDGVATLSGTAPDAKLKETALAAARGTTGVRNVVDRIRVERP
jgi:osmotically-inducible protein OsmY